MTDDSWPRVNTSKEIYQMSGTMSVAFTVSQDTVSNNVM